MFNQNLTGRWVEAENMLLLILILVLNRLKILIENYANNL